ncbi:hypothetical protein EON80_12065, partial [bacterium]
MNPLLSRELRSRWRDGRAFGLVFFFAAGLSLLLVLVYNNCTESIPRAPSLGYWAQLGQTLFTQLAWLQTLAWLLIAPTLTSSSIAYERERGWFDSLILTPLRPRQIVMGKWGSALLYSGILYVVALPCIALVMLFGGITPSQLALVTTLHILCAVYGASAGLAASAWSYRSHSALRSAHGIILIWLFSSFIGAVWSGKILARLITAWAGRAPTFWEWLGRTNPVLCASEISNGSPFQNWPLCFSILLGSTLFFLAIAVYYAGRPLEEAPYIEPRRRRKKDAPPLQSHGEIPLVTSLKFRNPVLDHEVRSKFRMRQPPLGVIIGESILGLLVAGFYVRTFYWALFEPKYRLTIWAGLIITGMIVTMMSAAVMGANGFSREREKGTWESIQLSMLRPGEIIRGKVFASILTCALFSLPVLPLLIPCINWSATGFTTNPQNPVTPTKAFWTVAIWLATVWSFTLVGMWIGRQQTRSAKASGQTLGLLGGFVVVGPIALYTLWKGGNTADKIAATFHPLATIMDWSLRNGPFGIFTSGPSYVVFHFLLGTVIWVF